MKKTFNLLIAFLLLFSGVLTAQKTDAKNYTDKRYAGDVILLKSWGELVGNVSHRVFVVHIDRKDVYYFNSLANMIYKANMDVYLDNNYWGVLKPSKDGWQNTGSNLPGQTLDIGKHEIRIVGNNTMMPMIEEIFVSPTRFSSRENPATESFLQKTEQLQRQPVQPAGVVENDDMNKVLPNPEGTYTHAIDTSFAYSHYSSIYLGVGYHTFTTSGSTVAPSLMIFNTSNLAHSWSNAYGGGGNEASLYIYVSVAGYHSVMLRPSLNNTSGTSNILYNGSTLVSGAVIGGRRFGLGGLKGGLLNFFTCRLSASSDTRLVVSKYSGSSARAYNDDYAPNGGDWSWGVASRIKKDFTGDEVEYVFLCAYSPSTTGTCDVYMACENSNVYNTNYSEFPLLKADDAIKAAPSSGYYNCISWSGGITSSWSWPPSAFSTYSCANTGYNYSDVTCFDNFYANNPVRYPGAWNYTRSGATVSNATVDVWKLGITYTHGSVRKPGNNHPHGYDWESKPGGLTRTFHPRNALTNNSWGYGAVSDYYRSTGTFARMTGVTKAIESDMDAVKAGLAVIENASLSFEAQQKLRSLVAKTDRTKESRLSDLYNAWDATKIANAIYSDPEAYCKNPEHEALAAYAKQHPREAMLFAMDKFVNANDHMIGVLLLMLTKAQYGYLLTEVKTERAANPNDALGRYRVHGDHDNGVLYVEKILKQLNDVADVRPPVEPVTIVASPNPAKDWFTVKLNVTAASTVSVKAMSAQTRAVKVLQAEKALAPGNYQFSLNATGFAGGTGDIITLQVIVNGEMKTVKVMVAK